jgi:hypothetical protein
VEMDRAKWLPCRLVPMDGGSPGRQVGPLKAGCTSAAWAPNGKSPRWLFSRRDVPNDDVRFTPN